ncbi:hypothetical protein HN031_16460 [Nocardioides sp. zg-1308]|uniref:hypothetical protein n=1 Tax=Nocardioides sp. zg-1308 TaxID=2736253 RepID=UPI001551BAFE|nr:hypothetical protein [Nocardioides sp. zg-1308]NPD06273.1 hypothetical protein [Nocardioides sp. zg-1308]
MTTGAGPARAEGTRTLTGPATGDASAFITYVGCTSLFADAAAPQSRLNLGPYSAPMGRRSLGLVPAARGSASGPYSEFGSLTRLDASVSVAATAGSTGVSYVLAVTRTSPRGTAWSGRADVAAAPGSWSTVSASRLSYDWTLVDLPTGAPLGPAGTATPAAFAEEHGDGKGFVVTGFGCDGKAFNLDAVRGSGSTFDFEGITLATAIAAERTRVPAGDEVAITGRVTDAGGRVTGDPLVLESRAPGGAWKPAGDPVLAEANGVARVVVRLTETTELRWHRPESQYADEGWSETVTVTVQQAPEQTAEQSPGQTPAQEQGGQSQQGQEQDQGQDQGQD